ncbi:unnamed protein product [Acanthoscelides obtectus]|uniref:Uncharacterized protein n=1 Tax=Acanthoscelides obtectus TaxID=200917 RepID=A0A9P0KJI0_ACAOB|nr:unnamed protein product [Acanthoscelides obtectus]CAK1656527.1 hypothetical protein AOBTE_LOCUS19774 [Acanthoscelides obtectus]
MESPRPICTMKNATKRSERERDGASQGKKSADLNELDRKPRILREDLKIIQATGTR